jgi:hypothetical protein
MKSSFCCFLFVLFLFSMSVFAQVNTASLSGTVMDASGAMVPDAKVVATNKATGVAFTTSTVVGSYAIPRLEVGEYTVTVEKAGFARVVEEIKLDVGQKARVDFKLPVSSKGEAVTVSDTVQRLATEDAAPGSVVENRLIRDLPLSARNWDDLLSQVAGVQADRYTEEGGATSSGRTGGANVHGVRSLQNNFILDGVDNNSISENVQELTTQVARPSVDSIQEFKVTTAPYSAEFGRSPGAAVSVTTRSGTNNFHGTAYDFLRNKVFNASPFNFTSSTPPPKPPNVQNQFGTNIGGPIIKNKAFFFFNYEGTRIRKGKRYVGSVPLSNELAGDFSAAAGAANGVSYATLVDRVGDCVGAGNPFPNNQIPARCLDPVAVKVLSLLPPPNASTVGAKNVNNFIRTPTLQDDTDSYTGRGDWQLNSSNNVFVRYTYSNRFRFVPGAYGGVVDGTGTSAFGRLSMIAHSAAIGWNTTLSPRLLNEFRLGWGRNDSVGHQDPFGQNTLASFGFLGVPDNPLYSGGIPGLNVSGKGGTPTYGAGSGVDRFGSPNFLPKFQKTNQFQWTDTISYVLSKHQLRGGIDLRLPLRNIFLDVPALRGEYSFDGNRTNIGLADFLLGYPSSVQVSTPSVFDSRVWMNSYFFQDDWKVSQTFTLNLGLRYDYATWPYEAAGRQTNFDPTTGQKFNRTNSSFGQSLVEPDKNNWAPRVGFAWQVAPKTVVRSGYGRFYSLFERAGSEDQMELNLPWLVNNNVSAANNNSTANNIRLRTGVNLSLDPSAVNPINVKVRAVDPHAQMPEIDQWNFGIQHELPANMLATVDYVGTKGTHLSYLMNLNQVFINGDGTASTVFPYTALGPIEFRSNGANSSYNGLEMTLEKRFSDGLAFRSSYTFAHSIDEAQEHLYSGGSNSFLQNTRDIRSQRGRSDSDYRHRFVTSYDYELPFGPRKKFLTEGLLAYIVGDWRTSGILTLRTGRPFTIFANGNNNAIGGPRAGGLVNSFANCVGDPQVDINRIYSGGAYFSTSAYAAPISGHLGNCGRNNVEGPGLTNFDLALARVFPVAGEGRNLEFRWEVFNALNTPQFGLPANNVSSASNFGKITSLAGDPRVMQFALKFYY